MLLISAYILDVTISLASSIYYLLSLLARRHRRESPGGIKVDLFRIIRLIDKGRRLGCVFVEHDVSLDHVRNPESGLVLEESASRDTEDLVQFLQSESIISHALTPFGKDLPLRLGYETEDAHEGDGVETGVEAKGTDDRHCGDHRRESQTQNSSEEGVDTHGPGHSLLSVNGGEYFGRILESNRTFGERIEDREEVDEQCDDTGTCIGDFDSIVDQEGQSGGEKHETHARESEEQEGSSSE